MAIVSVDREERMNGELFAPSLAPAPGAQDRSWGLKCAVEIVGGF